MFTLIFWIVVLFFTLVQSLKESDSKWLQKQSEIDNWLQEQVYTDNNIRRFYEEV